MSISDFSEKASTKKPKVKSQTTNITLPPEVLVAYQALMKNSKKIGLQTYQQKNKEKCWNRFIW